MSTVSCTVSVYPLFIVSLVAAAEMLELPQPAMVVGTQQLGRLLSTGTRPHRGSTRRRRRGRGCTARQHSCSTRQMRRRGGGCCTAAAPGGTAARPAGAAAASRASALAPARRWRAFAFASGAGAAEREFFIVARQSKGRAHRSSLPSCLQQLLTRGPEGLTGLAAMRRGLSVSSDSLSLRALCITAGRIPAQLKMSHIHINKGCAQPVHQLNGAGTHVNQGAEILFCLSTSKAFFS